jgi:hypothetical protein
MAKINNIIDFNIKMFKKYLLRNYSKDKIEKIVILCKNKINGKIV